MKSWQVRLILKFPGILPENVFQGGFPEKLPEPKARYPSKITQVINGYEFSLKTIETPPQYKLEDLVSEFVTLSFTSDSDSAFDVLESTQNLLESILDDLALQLQFFIPVVELEILDITKPIVIGDERDYILSQNPSFPYSKFFVEYSVNNRTINAVPKLKNEYNNINEKIRVAFRWYTKALAADFQIDKFIFFWISLELLWENSEIKKLIPYKNEKCGHEILKCPECGESTLKLLRGSSIKEYLVNFCGIGADLAKELWKMRQIMHGNNKLTPGDIKSIPNMNTILNSVVLISLKRYLNLPLDDIPNSTSDLHTLSPYFFIQGTKNITESDIN